jgi:hypothetical protein
MGSAVFILFCRAERVRSQTITRAALRRDRSYGSLQCSTPLNSSIAYALPISLSALTMQDLSKEEV